MSYGRGRRTSDGPSEPVYLVEDAECGVFGTCFHDEVATVAAQHYGVFHPDVRVIIGGLHYRSRIAPLRCDICGVTAEPPFWTHRSDPPTSLAEVVDHDGLWLVCDKCHELVLAKDLIKLVQRMWAIAVQNSPFLATAPHRDRRRADYAELARRLLANLDGGTRDMIVSEPEK